MLNYRRAYYEKNKERELAVNREWSRKNREKCREIRKKFYYAHREKNIAKVKKYNSKRKDKIAFNDSLRYFAKRFLLSPEEIRDFIVLKLLPEEHNPKANSQLSLFE